MIKRTVLLLFLLGLLSACGNKGALVLPDKPEAQPAPAAPAPSAPADADPSHPAP